MRLKDKGLQAEGKVVGDKGKKRAAFSDRHDYWCGICLKVQFCCLKAIDIAQMPMIAPPGSGFSPFPALHRGSIDTELLCRLLNGQPLLFSCC